jgi:hypothetical protein
MQSGKKEEKPNQIAIHVSRWTTTTRFGIPQAKNPSGPKLKEYKKSFGRELDPLDMRIVSALCRPFIERTHCLFLTFLPISPLAGTLVQSLRWIRAKWTFPMLLCRMGEAS